ncbi:MAG: hypothetical protein ACLSTW_02225 [Faecalibacterium sp.]
MDKWLILVEESVLAAVEFLGLAGYEVLISLYAMKAFLANESEKEDNLPLFGRCFRWR